MTLFSDWLLWGGLANLLLFRFHSTWTPLTSTCSSWLQSGRANNSERYEQYVAGLTAFSFFLECLPNHVQCFSKSVGNPFEAVTHCVRSKENTFLRDSCSHARRFDQNTCLTQNTWLSALSPVYFFLTKTFNFIH